MPHIDEPHPDRRSSGDRSAGVPAAVLRRVAAAAGRRDDEVGIPTSSSRRPCERLSRGDLVVGVDRTAGTDRSAPTVARLRPASPIYGRATGQHRYDRR